MSGSLDTAPCFYFVCREDGTLLEVNGTLCTRLGYTKAELAQGMLERIFTLPTRIFQQTHFAPLLKMQGHAEEIFISLLAKDGEHVPVLINARREMAEGEMQLVHIGIEVQNRKRFENELIAARNAAQKALADNSELLAARRELEQSLAVLDEHLLLTKKYNKELLQFNKIITHDLQEPVRKMSVFVNMLSNGGKSVEPYQLVERLTGAVAKMRMITSGLQQYMWLSEKSLKLTQVDISGVLQQVQEQLKSEFPSVHLSVRAERLLPFVADEEQMRVLLYQILSNVIRFRKKGTHATARIAIDRQERNRYKQLDGRYKYAAFIRLEIADEGLGINNEQPEKAFELFGRLHAESGSGLGLALCRRIVDMHHGEISITGIEGIGTTVRILLPPDLPANAEASQ